MRLLLDTHIWLWLLEKPDRISRAAFAQIEGADELLLSVASIWEFSIKARLGKLTTALPAKELRNEILSEMSATELGITGDHAILATELPLVHRDPFDRMLIAQSYFEKLTLVTADAQMRKYEGQMIWADSARAPRK